MHILGYTKSELEALGAAYTAREIHNQPALWEMVYHQFVMEKEKLQLFLDDSLQNVQKVILTGAGTSAYIGISLQGVFNRKWKIHTTAVATTDLVSHPNDYFFSHESILLISFARSGNSPESTAVTVLADQLCKTCYHFIITCDPQGNLAHYVGKKPGGSLTLVLPPESNDQSLAMTGSYSSMLLAGLMLTRIHAIEAMEQQVKTIVGYGKLILDKYVEPIKSIAAQDFGRAVFLGSGPFLGTATESALKLQELTDGQIICKQDSYLGFRHGPKAVTNEKTLVVFIFSNREYVLQYERDLVSSMKKGKKPMLTISISEQKLDSIIFDQSIVLSENGPQVDEELLVICHILPAQLLGLFKSISIGLKPDAPSVTGAISRVVEDVKIYQY